MEDQRELAKRRFGDSAERYVRSQDHSRGESLDRMLDLVDPGPGWLTLDVATGGGHTALKFAPSVERVVASDLTREMLAAAGRFIRGRGVRNVLFAAADALALPFKDATFDCVTCRVAPHHFPSVSRFVKEIARVLRPGGVAAVIDNVVPEGRVAADFINALEKRRDPSHVRALPPSRWIGLFTDAGLAVRAVERFRKVRDFDHWMGMQGVDEGVKTEVRAMLREIPAEARAALAPEESEGKLRLYLNEILVVADLLPSSPP